MVAIRHDPHWQAVFARLEPHLERIKVIVAVVCKLLMPVWHSLVEEVADRPSDSAQVT